MKNGIKLFLYCHLKILANKDDHPSVTVPFLTELSGLPAVEHLWRDLPERYGPWQTVYSRFKWMEDGILDNIFRVLSLDARIKRIINRCLHCQAHQHSAGAKKGAIPTGIEHVRGGASTKIHAIVDAYGYPVYVMLVRDGVMILITPSFC